VLTVTIGTAMLPLAQETFTIVPAVTRVTGTLAAVPKQARQGEPVALNLAVTNIGFGALTGLPLTVTVTNNANQQVVAQFADSANIALSGTYRKVFTWPATGAVGTSYTAELAGTINRIARILAQDSLNIMAPQVQLDVALAGLKQSRVLVSCKPDDDHGESDDGKFHNKGSEDSDGDSHGHENTQCSARRKLFLDSYLTGLGITHFIATSEMEFKRAFRSGQYNAYWISGGREELHDNLDKELREAIFRGDALILDGVHDDSERDLDSVTGVKIRGKLNPNNQSINVVGPIFAPGTLATVGRPLEVDLITGEAQATFPASANSPAIVTNQYGQGRVVLFAYDLLGTLIARPSAAQTDLVQANLAWVAPEPAAVSAARSYTVLRARIGNVGSLAELRATFTPPAGGTVLGTAPAAQPDASGRPVWSFTLDSGATKNLDIGLRLSAASANNTASIAIDSIRNGVAAPYGSFGVTLSVESADIVAPRLGVELAALNLANSDKSDRDHAIAGVLAAQSSLAAGAYEQAIGRLINVAGRLLKITSGDVSAQRVEVDRLLQEAQMRWYLAQPRSR
jgi:hypothetical protein